MQKIAAQDGAAARRKLQLSIGQRDACLAAFLQRIEAGMANSAIPRAPMHV
jgi:hypothetical protein